MQEFINKENCEAAVERIKKYSAEGWSNKIYAFCTEK